MRQTSDEQTLLVCTHTHTNARTHTHTHKNSPAIKQINEITAVTCWEEATNELNGYACIAYKRTHVHTLTRSQRHVYTATVDTRKTIATVQLSMERALTQASSMQRLSMLTLTHCACVRMYFIVEHRCVYTPQPIAKMTVMEWTYSATRLRLLFTVSPATQALQCWFRIARTHALMHTNVVILSDFGALSAWVHAVCIPGNMNSGDRRQINDNNNVEQHLNRLFYSSIVKLHLNECKQCLWLKRHKKLFDNIKDDMMAISDGSSFDLSPQLKISSGFWCNIFMVYLWSLQYRPIISWDVVKNIKICNFIYYAQCLSSILKFQLYVLLG